MNKTEDKKTPIIDIELQLYAHAAKAEATGTQIGELVDMCEQAIQGVLWACKASNHYLVVSGRNNFRKVLHADYKAGRPPKPPLYNELSEAIKNNHKGRWLVHDQLEADDLASICLTNGRIPNPILCSIDKDMLSVPGFHYNWNKDDWPGYVDEATADYHWLMQLLHGDPTDKIEGMVGIGPAKAEKLIKKHKVIFGIDDVPTMAKKIYEAEGFSLNAFYKCLHLVTIWRKPMHPMLLENDLIKEITKTIESL